MAVPAHLEGVMAAVWTETRVGGSAKFILLSIARRAAPKRYGARLVYETPETHVREIAADVGLCEKAVSKNCKSLVQLGALEVVRGRLGGRGNGIVWRVNLDPLPSYDLPIRE